MILKELLAETKILSLSGALNAPSTISIKSLCFDSRHVTPGALFFALAGTQQQGDFFANEAVARGAVAVVTQEELPSVTVPVIRVANTRIAMGEMAAAFYRWPSHTLAVCGVTGTNGKTTTSYLVRHLCEANGRACGLVGTVEYILPGIVTEAARTTPESIDLQRMMEEMRRGGFKAVTMEVSSHAVVQERVHGTEFDGVIFTNLTQDHLDYHGSMEAYFEAKATLFEMLSKQQTKKGRAIINSDDRYGRLLLERFSSKLPVVTFGQSSNADFRASDIHYTSTGTTFRMDARGKSYLVRSPLIGLFNVYNALGALAAATAMGLELRRAVKALETAPQVPGRLQRLPGKNSFQVFVDYAHTPDALENVLRSLRQLQPERLVVVFGCGGDRDRSKRPLMAAAAEVYADSIIVTTDNPRGEDPDAIIAEVEHGFRQKRHQSISDREKAIMTAIEQALPNDMIVIAGKGHETYQEVKGVRSSFDDVTIALRAMNSRRGPSIAPNKF